MSRPTWAEHAMNIAAAAALRSEEAVRVGACVLDGVNITLGVGYNGLPSGVNPAFGHWNRDGRRAYAIHAEANALRYTTPDRAREGLLATTHYPCAPCVVLARSYGIRRIYWQHPPDWDRYPELDPEFLKALHITLERITTT